MQVIKQTKSLCPECLQVLDATIFEEDNKVYIKKECPDHGKVTELYWSDYEQYQRATEFRHVGTGLENPRTETKKDCPYDCGICPEHKSHTGLAIIDVTNRCNLTCPVCFANAAQAGYVYEPTKEQMPMLSRIGSDWFSLSDYIMSLFRIFYLIRLRNGNHMLVLKRMGILA